MGSRVVFGLAFLLSFFVPSVAFADSYTFQTITSPSDPAFTEALGINDAGTIAGYYGDGSVVPSKGFTLAPPSYTVFTSENFPGSAQTQVAGINGSGYTAGSYVDAGGNTHGFTLIGGTFTTVDSPGTTFNQLLSINGSDVAAGFSETSGVQSPFTESGGVFTDLDGFLPANKDAEATGVNNTGVVSGFFVDTTGTTHGFLLVGGVETTLDYPGATFTQALGLNNDGQVVGDYIDASGYTHGFLYDIGTGTYTEINDPLGMDTTTINGINDSDALVGFYVDAAGNTDGFVATTASVTAPEPASGSLLIIGMALLGLMVARKRLALGQPKAR